MLGCYYFVIEMNFEEKKIWFWWNESDLLTIVTIFFLFALERLRLLNGNFLYPYGEHVGRRPKYSWRELSIVLRA